MPARPPGCLAADRFLAPVQDIRAALLGLDGVLKLMRQHTGPLIEAHRAARRAALLAGPAAPSTPPPASAAGFATGQRASAASNSSNSHYSRSPTAGISNSNGLQVLGPLAAAKLANANQGSPGAGSGGGSSRSGSGGGSASGGGAGFAQHSTTPTGGSMGSGMLDDAPARTPNSHASSSPSVAVTQASQGSPAAGAAGMLGGIGCMRRTAMDVAAAGGDVESQEPILLRVLCHRSAIICQLWPRLGMMFKSFIVHAHVCCG